MTKELKVMDCTDRKILRRNGFVAGVRKVTLNESINAQQTKFVPRAGNRIRAVSIRKEVVGRSLGAGPEAAFLT